MTEAFLELIQDGGRIANVSSGGASSWVRQQDEATKKFYSDPDISKEALEADVAKQAAGSEGGWPGTYGLSKAGLTAYTLYLIRVKLASSYDRSARQGSGLARCILHSRART